MFYFIVTLSGMLVIIFLLFFFTWKNGGFPTPTPNQIRSTLLFNLPDIRKGTVVELGSGWGHLAFSLSKKYPDCTVIGYENSPIPFLCGVFLNYQPNLKMVWGDFFQASLEGVNLVVCYLSLNRMEQLRDKLERELDVGAWVVSHTYPIPKWKPKAMIDVDDSKRSRIYIYKLG